MPDIDIVGSFAALQDLDPVSKKLINRIPDQEFISAKALINSMSGMTVIHNRKLDKTIPNTSK